MDKDNQIKIINEKISEFNVLLLSSDHDPLYQIEQSDLVKICKILNEKYTKAYFYYWNDVLWQI